MVAKIVIFQAEESPQNRSLAFAVFESTEPLGQDFPTVWSLIASNFMHKDIRLKTKIMQLFFAEFVGLVEFVT